MTSFFEKNFSYFYYTYLILLLLYVLYKPLLSYPDTHGYLNISIIRSATYPTFLLILKAIFGDFQDISIKFFHGFFGIVSISFFVKTLRNNLNFNYFLLFATLAFVSFPYIFSVANIGNKILSEGIAYPLYLVVISYLIYYLIKEKSKYLFYLLPFLFLLIQTRSQFLFLIPVSLVVIIYVSYKNKTFLENKYLLLTFICLPIFTSLTDRLYHKIVHNQFVNTPWTGIHIITPAFFVADSTDAFLYKDLKQRLFFKSTFNALTYKKLTLHQVDKTKIAPINFYVKNFSKIANHTILEVGKNKIFKNLSYNEKLIEIDKITKTMTLSLIMNNFKLWLKIYVKNFIHAFGSFKYLLLHVFFFLFSIYRLYKKDSKTHKFIALIMLLTFANIALVSIGMHTITRFVLYNQWTIFLALFTLLNLLQKTDLAKNE